MTLRELIEWAEREGVSQDAELRLFTEHDGGHFEEVTHANENGPSIQLNGDSVDWESK